MRTAQYEDTWGSLVLVFFTDGGISSCADKVSNSTAKTGPMETADISVLLLFQTGVPWNRCSISLLEKELSLARSLARSLSPSQQRSSNFTQLQFCKQESVTKALLGKVGYSVGYSGASQSHGCVQTHFVPLLFPLCLVKDTGNFTANYDATPTPRGVAPLEPFVG